MEQTLSEPPSWADIYATVPIERATRSIRLLTLRRDAQGDIIGHLEAHNLDDCKSRPKWIALSYTWDSYELVGYSMRRRPDKDTYTLKINDAEVSVRENLWHALNAILDQRARFLSLKTREQSDDEERWNPIDREVTDLIIEHDACFWIDAICINQADILERNHQVDMMKMIYSDAALVVAWLGPPWKEIGPGRETSLTACFRERRFNQRCECEPEYLFCSTRTLTQSNTRHSVLSEVEAHWLSIARSAYWCRMWIVQEVVLSKRIIFLYGLLPLGPDFLENNFHERTHGRIESDPMHLLLSQRLDMTPMSIAQARDAETELREPSLRLLPIIDKYRLNGCSDQRDRVYALLGLLAESYPIKADYSISPFELLIQVCRHERPSLKDFATVRACAHAVGLAYRNRDLRRLLRYLQIGSAVCPETSNRRKESSARELARWVNKEIEQWRQNPHYRQITHRHAELDDVPREIAITKHCACEKTRAYSYTASSNTSEVWEKFHLAIKEYEVLIAKATERRAKERELQVKKELIDYFRSRGELS